MDSDTYIGCRKDLKAAVNLASDYFNCTPSALRLPHPQATNDFSGDFCKRVAFFLKLYGGKLPLDLDYLIRQARRSKRIPSSMVLPYILCKFPSHREAVFDTVATLKSCTDSYELYTSLLAQLSKTKLPDVWVRNVGRKNMYHATFTMFASGRLGLLSKISSKSKVAPKSKYLTFGKGMAKYSVASCTPKIRQSLQAIEHFGKELDAAPVPTTVRQWINLSSTFSKHASKVPGLSGQYRRLWAIRCALILRMRRVGITRLKLHGETVRDFQGAFPDQKNLLAKVAGGKYELHRKIKDIFSDCSYTGPPELFTMWICLISDKAVQSVSLRWMTEHQDALRACFQNILSRDKVTPHPGVLVEEFKKQQLLA